MSPTSHAKGCFLGLLAAAVLLVAGGCDRQAPGPAAIRLAEIVDGTEVEWPEASGPIPAKLVKPADIGALPSPERLARVTMFEDETGRDDRLALLAPAGARYRFRLSLPAGEPVLRLGLGHVLPPKASDRAVRFRVRVGELDDEAATILDESVAVLPNGEWLDRELPLARWAGRTVRLDLETEGTPGQEPVWAAWSSPEVLRPAVPEEGWDVLLIVLDTLRPDHLSCYGYDRPTSPQIDAFAGRGIRFATAISQSSWTKPAHRALFSGLYPRSRGDLQSPPLAEVLWRAGYRTVGVTGGAMVSHRFGFDRGFDAYQTEYWVHDVEQVVHRLEANRGRKHFLFLHTYEIHEPYRHRELAGQLDPGRIGDHFERDHWMTLRDDMTDAEKAYVRALYDSGIRYTDERLGVLFAHLAEFGLADRTIVVLTSDHGEQLWEHGGWGHGQNMFDHQTRIPLIVSLPPDLSRELGRDPQFGSVIADQVQLVDLYPTLLELLGIPLTHPIQGRSLVPLLAGRTMPPTDAFSEETYLGKFEVKALRSPPYKYVYSFPKEAPPAGGNGEVSTALFDLGEDPGEHTDLSDQLPGVAAEMRGRLEGILSADPEPQGRPRNDLPADGDPELLEQLKALGYVTDEPAEDARRPRS